MRLTLNFAWADANEKCQLFFYYLPNWSQMYEKHEVILFSSYRINVPFFPLKGFWGGGYWRGSWSISRHYRIIHRRTSVLQSSWQKRVTRMPSVTMIGVRRRWPSNGRPRRRDGKMATTMRLANYAIYESVGIQDVKFHCTIQRAFWFCSTSHTSSLEMTLYKVYNAAPARRRSVNLVSKRRLNSPSLILPWSWRVSNLSCVKIWGLFQHAWSRRRIVGYRRKSTKQICQLSFY